MWESLGFIIAFAYSFYLCTSVKLYVLTSVLVVGICGYLGVEYVHWNETQSKRNASSAVEHDGQVNGSVGLNSDKILKDYGDKKTIKSPNHLETCSSWVRNPSSTHRVAIRPTCETKGLFVQKKEKMGKQESHSSHISSRCGGATCNLILTKFGVYEFLTDAIVVCQNRAKFILLKICSLCWLTSQIMYVFFHRNHTTYVITWTDMIQAVC